MITDQFLTNMAKAAAGESFSSIEYFAFGSTVVANIDPTDTALAGEVGARKATSAVRTDNAVEFNATRLATDVVGGSGDVIASFGTDIASSGSNLQSGVVVAGVTHTNAFDIDCVVTLTVTR